MVEAKFVIGTIFTSFLAGKLGKLPVDKALCLWFNDKRIHGKDNDGKILPSERSREPAAGVSRCGKLGDLLPESVL